MSQTTCEFSRPGHPKRLDTAVRLLLALAAAMAGDVAASTDGHETQTTHVVPLFPSASDGVRQGFVRVINHSDAVADVRIDAVDDGGASFGPLMLTVGAGEVVPFNSGHLENGDPDRGWDIGTGPGEGDWRLVLSSELDIEVLSYIRILGSGFVTSMHDTAPAADAHGGETDDGHGHGDDEDDDGHGHDDDGHSDDDDHAYRVAIFNPGSNANQVSRLRVVNAGDHAANVEVSGTDDHGHASAGTVGVTVPAGAARTFSAAELEAGGDGMTGALGDGDGKWRLTIRSNEPVLAMSLLRSPTGHLTNLSTAPDNQDAQGRHGVPFLPAASDPFGRQGFVRVINHGSAMGAVEIRAFDDAGAEFGPISLSLDAGETRHFNSNDLELGAAGKGLSGGVGSGDGDWRLALSSDLDIEVLTYIRTTQDGFLTSLHDTVPAANDRHRVVFFNPASNTNLQSWLRLVNPGEHAAAVEITGTDDRAASPGTHVELSLPAGAALTLTSTDLENGTEDIEGALGDGAGKWRLDVASDEPIVAMSLLSSTAGYLTNLSTAPTHGAREERAEEVFLELISAPIVQARCVTCHVEGGLATATRLIFAPSSQADHATTNFSVFREFLASDDHDDHDHEDDLDHMALILAKIQGMEDHGGGVQITADTEDFHNMELFLALLRAEIDAEDDGDHDDDHHQ